LRRHLIAKRGDVGAGDRIAELIDDAPAERSTSRQSEISDELLALGQRHRVDVRERAALAELLLNVAGLRRAQSPSARRQIAKQEWRRCRLLSRFAAGLRFAPRTPSPEWTHA
jgi:hypothetical protein